MVPIVANFGVKFDLAGVPNDVPCEEELDKDEAASEMAVIAYMAVLHIYVCYIRRCVRDELLSCVCQFHYGGRCRSPAGCSPGVTRSFVNLG
eukprot:jgi/Botrbrau1/12748/Bobra.67_1s0107.1